MGILDFLNRPTNSPYSEDMRMNAGMQSLGLLGGTMMAAGAPSTDPGQYGRIMAQGLAQAGPMMQQSLDQQMQMEQMAAEREREAAMQEYLASGGGGLLTPEQASFLSMVPFEVGASLLGKQMFAGAGDPFTLGPDEIRFDANGNLIAEGPESALTPTSAQNNALALGLVPGTPEYNAYLRDVTMPKSTTVEINNPAPPFSNTTPLQDEIAKIQADRYQTIFDRADSAYTMLDTIENIRAVGLETGSLTSVAGELAGVMRTLGFGDLADQWLGIDPSDVEAYSSFANAMALAQKDSALGGGVLSDSDLAMLKTLAADPNNQPLANAIILGAMERSAKLQIAERDTLDQWTSIYGSMGKRITPEEASDEIPGSEGKTFNQYWSERRAELAEQFRSQDIGANVSLPSLNLEINGQTISQMTPDAILAADRSNLSTEQLEAMRQRIIILQEQGLM
jgi:hypothetical protein